MIPASVAATAVAAAGGPLCTMGVLVVVTSDDRIIVQLPCKESLYCLVAGAADTSVELDACIPQCHLCTATDAAADQGINPQPGQELRQSPMSEAVRIHDLC